MNRYLFAALVLFAACGKNPVGTPPPPPPSLDLHDPEILFHFFYHRDSPGGALHTEPYPDTAIMRWYRDSTPDRLLAQVEISGVDTVCAYFLVTSGTPMYFDILWKRHGTITSSGTTVGPFDPTNPKDNDAYWDVQVSEDTLAKGGSSSVASSPTLSFCPKGMRRDSISANALP